MLGSWNQRWWRSWWQFLQSPVRPTEYKTPLGPKMHPKIHPESPPETKSIKNTKDMQNAGVLVFYVFFLYFGFTRGFGVYFGVYFGAQRGFVFCRGKQFWISRDWIVRHISGNWHEFKRDMSVLLTLTSGWPARGTTEAEFPKVAAGGLPGKSECRVPGAVPGQRRPEIVYVGPFFASFPRKMRHINSFLGAQHGVFWVGGQKVYVEKVYVLFPSPALRFSLAVPPRVSAAVLWNSASGVPLAGQQAILTWWYFYQRHRYDNINKICVLEGVGEGENCGKLSKNAVFHEKFHDNKVWKKDCEFYCQKFCCHWGGSYLDIFKNPYRAPPPPDPESPKPPEHQSVKVRRGRREGDGTQNVMTERPSHARWFCP